MSVVVMVDTHWTVMDLTVMVSMYTKYSVQVVHTSTIFVTMLLRPSHNLVTGL